MKTKLLSLLFFLFILISFTASAQWTWLNPKPSGNTGKSITFINEQTGFIVNNSQLLYTNNAGTSWEVKQSITNGNEIRFKGEIGFIVGDLGTVYKSTDGGAKWEKLSVNTTENLNTVTIPHADTIFITGDKSLLKSEDGGANWTIAAIQAPAVYNLTIRKSFFVSSKIGHAVCNAGYILKTIDGGVSWYVTERVNTSPSNFFTIYFVNSQIGFATREHSEIFKTSDGGETWYKLPSTSDAIYSFYFLNESVGFITGDHGVIHKTTNGGATWQWAGFQNGRYDGTDMYGIYFTDENTGYATGMRGRILKTSDGGKSWNDYAFTYNDIGDIRFPTNETGYALGSNVYKTTDSGESWNTLNTGLNEETNFYRLAQFFSADTGYVVAHDGYYSNSIDHLLKTTDGGSTWTKHIVDESMQRISAMHFINNRVGYLSITESPYGSSVVKTIDGGKTWEKISGFGNASKMHFVDINRGFAVRYGELYRTTDAGATWAKVYEVYGSFTDISFVNEKVGYISAEYNTVLKTTDGGDTWIELKTEYDHLQAITFYNENVGYVTGEYGKHFRTSDGGLTWQPVNMPSQISKLRITQNKNIFAAGAYGRILRSTVEYDDYVAKVLPATGVTAVGAILTGVIASNGEEISDIKMEYGAAGKFDKSINAAPDRIAAGASAKLQVPIQGLLPSTTYSFRLKASYKGTAFYTTVAQFTTLPEFTIDMAYFDNITSSSIALGGRVVSNLGEITGIQFEYGTDSAFGKRVDATPSTVTKNSSASLSASLQQLQPSTKYFIRVKINYKGKEHYGPTSNFTTRPEYLINIQKPVVTDADVMLYASVKSNKGNITNIAFEYGKNRQYGSESAATPDAVQETYWENVQATLTGLHPDSVYFFRLKAKQGDRYIYSGDHLFRASGGVLLEPGKAEQITGAGAVLSGLIAPQGSLITNIQIEYGETEELGNVVNAIPNYLTSGSTSTVQAGVSDLAANTAYFFRVKGVVGGQTIYSESQKFMTTAPTGSPEEIDSRLVIYPNPVHDKLLFSHQEYMQRIELFNQLGIVVQIITLKEQHYSLDISSYAPGVYYARVYSNEQVHVRRIVKL